LLSDYPRARRSAPPDNDSGGQQGKEDAMPKVLLDPLVLLAILVGMVFWGLSALSDIPNALWIGWTIGAVIALGLAVVLHNGRKKRGV
jgi:hypothetical protein